MGTVDILAFADVGQSHDFASWKKTRPTLLSKLGEELLTLSEREIRDYFEVWDASIKQQLPIERLRSQMAALMAFSLFHYFLGDVDAVRASLDSVKDLIYSQNRDLVKAALQVFHWMGHRFSDRGTLFKPILEIAFSWIQEKQTKLYFNALYTIWKARRFSGTDILAGVHNSYQTIFQIACSADPALRKLAVDVIRFQHIQLCRQSSLLDPAKASFQECSGLVLQKASTCEGAIMILRNLYSVRPTLFDNLNQLTSVLSEMCLSQTESIAVAAYQLVATIAEHKIEAFDRPSINRVFQGLYGKMGKNSNEFLFEVYNRLLRAFRTLIPAGGQRDIVVKLITNSSDRKIISLGFSVLATLLELFPDLQVPSQVFQGIPICVNYIKCLSLQKTLPGDVKQHLLNSMQRGLAPRAQPSTISLCLRLVRTFRVEVFEDAEKAFNAVSPLVENASEAIRSEVIHTVSLLESRDSQEFLMNTAIYDPSKDVRLAAVSEIRATPELAANTDILLTMRDSSFKVRRKGFKLIGKLVKFNPLDLSFPVVDFFGSAIQIVSTTSGIKQLYRFASLLPIFAKQLIDTIRSFIPNMIVVCLKLLGVSEESDDENPSDFPGDGFGVESIVEQDGFNDPDSQLKNMEELPRTDPGRAKIYRIVNEKYLDGRDRFLLRTLAYLGNDYPRFRHRILKAFHRILTVCKSPKLLASAVKSLTVLCASVGTGLNLRLNHQYFIPVLMKKLISTNSDEVSVAILKLFGTACDSVTVSEIKTSSQRELGIDLVSNSFFTDFTMKHLIPYFDNPTSELFDALTRIYDLAARDAAKFVYLVIPMFLQGIGKANEKGRHQLFESLEVVTRECPIESSQFLRQLTEVQLKYLNDVGAIKLAACLSFHFMSDYVHEAAVLFLPGCRRVGKSDSQYFKFLIRFLMFAVLFQDQPFENFLDVLEHKVSDRPEPIYLKLIVKNLICLVENKDLSLYQARLGLLEYQILQQEKSRLSGIALLGPLITHTGLPIKIIESWHLNLTTHVKSFEKKKPKFKDFHPRSLSSPNSGHLFTKFSVPNELNLEKWLETLCQGVINENPSVVIRSCSNLFPAIRKQLFPIAFLSCWQKTSADERKHFSGIVRRMINVAHPHSFFVSIIELLDRAFLPLDINDDELAEASRSRPLTLFFLQRMFRNDPMNQRIIEKLLDLNTTMGRHSVAHGMLVHAKGQLEDTKIALWSEKLGEWDRALQLYGENRGADVSSMLRCYAHLEMWDNIKAMGNLFEEWDISLKEENAKHFAWAYYHSGDFERVEYYMKQFHLSDPHLSEVLFNGFFFLRTQKYELCQDMITKAFDLLAKDTSVYMSGDAIRLHKNLHYSQMFIELQEALDILRCGVTPDIWNKRLKGFCRDSESWIRLIAIRSLVFAPGENIRVYLKMISVLRKERRWNLINTYFERFFSQSVLPNVELAQSKILWARGQKDAAIDCLKMTLDIMSLQDPEFLEVGLSKLPLRIFSVLSKHLDNMEIPEEKTELQRMAKEQPILLSRCFRDMLSPVLDGRMESRICRTLGSFMFSRYEHTLDILRLINDMYERAKTSYDKDYKVWLGWAYVNARMIDIVQNDEHAINAVNGFLKATELRPSNTLEFMCQLFSIFFRLKDGSLISQTLTTDLLNLRASVVSQIIPQITVQVAHPNATIRGVVHRILTTFGKEHFQMIFFPLNLYRLSEHREKATFARELLSFLCDLHPDVAADADLFVDGLLRAAISWFEQWILALDAASRAYHEEDMDRMDRILDNLFKSIENPKCDLDGLFVRLHGAAIEQYRRKFEEHTGPAIRSLWDSFKYLFGLLSDRVKKLELILLPKVSEELALKRGFKIAVPGTYSVEKKVPLLDHIEPALQVLGTQQHPRCVFMVSSDGSKLKFLLKGNEDIRLDERVMQFFTLINLLMNQLRTTRELGARIVEYAIIPLSPNAGLITWVTGADTLHQMICEQRQLHNIGQSIEFDMLNEIVGRVFNSMTLYQRLEMFDEITAKCGAKEIREILWGRAPNAVTWISQSQNFTVTTSLMSMVGYVIGLGDRHPSNIMVQRETGKVIHIDFGDSFENARLRNKFPEKVPFRLTRMIVNALDSGTVEGIFRKTCEDIMWVLRDSKASLVALLEIFVHEPLDELEGQSKRRFQTKIIDQVAQKLMGKDERLSVDESDLDIEGQVDALIREASDPLNYVAHYEGWCPFW